MKILIVHYLGIFLSSAVISVLSENVYLAAGSRSSIAEDVYRRIKKENPSLRNSPHIEPETKMRLCYHITGSTLFTHAWKEQPIFMHEWYATLRDNHDYDFGNLYESKGQYMNYTNKTRQVEVYANKKDKDTLDEFIFTCLSVKSDGGKSEIVSYSISAEYNLSDIPSTYIPGRFIFYHVDGNRNKREVYALAERPAKSMFPRDSGTAVEWEYVRRKAGHSMADEKNDPICRLGMYQRLRVCTTILTSTYFQGEIKFAPTLDYIDEKACTKRTVHIQDDYVRQSVWGYEYEDWMISCRPKQYCTKAQSEFYVGRGYGSFDEFFLFRTKSNYSSTIVIENLFEDVRSIV